MSNTFSIALSDALDKKGITIDQYYDKIHITGSKSSKVHLYFKIEALLKSQTMWFRPDFYYQDIAELFAEYIKLYYKQENALELARLKISMIPNKQQLYYHIFEWLLKLYAKVAVEE